MKKNQFLFFTITFLILGIFTTTNSSSAAALNQNGYNQNRILEDSVLLNTNSMTTVDIQNFLSTKGSFLASYVTPNAYGISKTAAEIISDAAKNNYDCDGASLSDSPTEAERMVKCRKITTVNPQFLLVLLQKEASLITNPSPSQKLLDQATGYGCPTGGICNPYWKGFGKQVNSAALQFLAYIQEPSKYKFQVGGTYIAKDRYSMLQSLADAIKNGTYNTIVASPDFVNVTIENKATAALYNYTPHVYNGNYNTHKLMNDYFGTGDNDSGSFFPAPIAIKRQFPNGTLLKAENQPEIWLIENGTKRHFTSWAAFASRYRLNQVLKASEEEIASYPIGAAIKFANYSLLQTEDGKIYLIVDKEKRPFDSLATYKKIGFNPEELELASSSELSAYMLGKTITATSSYITGALLKDSLSQAVYYVENGNKALIDKNLIAIKYPDWKITTKTSKELAAFTTIDPILLDEGSLAKTANHTTVYLISDGKKRPFASEEALKNMGFDMANIITMSSQFLYNYEMGEKIN